MFPVAPFPLPPDLDPAWILVEDDLPIGLDVREVPAAELPRVLRSAVAGPAQASAAQVCDPALHAALAASGRQVRLVIEPDIACADAVRALPHLDLRLGRTAAASFASPGLEALTMHVPSTWFSAAPRLASLTVRGDGWTDALLLRVPASLRRLDLLEAYGFTLSDPRLPAAWAHLDHLAVARLPAGHVLPTLVHLRTLDQRTPGRPHYGGRGVLPEQLPPALTDLRQWWSESPPDQAPDDAVGAWATAHALDHLHVPAVPTPIPAVRRLSVAWGRRPTPAACRALGQAPALRELDLAFTSVDDDCVRAVAANPRLERLDVRGTYVSAAGLEALLGHPRLRELRVDPTAFTTDRALSLLPSWIGTLNLSDSQVTPRGLALVARHRELRALGLDRVKVDLAPLAGHPLTALSLRETSLSPANVRQLADLPELRHLALDGATLSAEAVRGLSALPRLETLSLAGVRVTGGLDAALSGLRPPALRRLDLEGTDLRAPALPPVRELSLAYTRPAPALLDELGALEVLDATGMEVPQGDWARLIRGLSPRLRLLLVDDAHPAPRGPPPETPPWLLGAMSRALQERSPFRDARLGRALRPEHLAAVTAQLALLHSVVVTGENAVAVTFVAPQDGVYRVTMGKTEVRRDARAGERVETTWGGDLALTIRLDGADWKVRVQRGRAPAPEDHGVHPGLTPAQAALRTPGTLYASWWPADQR